MTSPSRTYAIRRFLEEFSAKKLTSFQSSTPCSSRFLVRSVFVTVFVITIAQLIIFHSHVITTISPNLDEDNPQMTALEHHLEEFYFARRPEKVEPFLYDVIRKPNWFCRNTKRPPFAVILIASHPNETEKRAAIRGTWGSSIRRKGSINWPGGRTNLTKSDSRIQLAFVVGLRSLSFDVVENDTVLREEILKFDDIIQGNFLDSYWNLTTKSTFTLRVMFQQCPTAKFLIKADTDVFINIPYLVQVLKKLSPRRSILGSTFENAVVQRTGKHMLSYEEYPFRKFPPYEAGPLYIITSDLYLELFETSEFMPQMKIEDVFITGVLGRTLNVTHIQMENFFGAHDEPVRGDDIVKNLVMVRTLQKPDALFQTWSEIKSILRRTH